MTGEKTSPERAIYHKRDISHHSMSSFDKDIDLRRVWVKRLDSAPTAVYVSEPDLVDDLKQAICDKFPNTIGRIVDPADLIVVANVVNGSNYNNLSVYSNHRKSVNFSHANDDNSHLAALDADQKVWSILDQHFPNGMEINDAFLIKLPSKAETLPPENSDGNNFLDVEGNSASVSSSKSSRNFYHQPFPVHVRDNSMYEADSGYKCSRETSLSPNSVIGRQGSVLNTYKESPLNDSQQRNNSTFSPYKNDERRNPSAVLLLPKNFSMRATRNHNANSPHLASVEGNRQEEAPGDHNSQKVFKIKNKPCLNDKQDQVPQQKDHDKSPDVSERDVQKDGSDSLRERGSSPEQTSTPNSMKNILRDDKHSRNNIGQVSSSPNSSPLKQTKKDRRYAMRNRSEVLLPSVSVLVVEDNAINQAILGAFLRKHKIPYEIAKNGQEAIEKWRKGGFHLVLMDIQLPVKSGIEATKQIRYLERVNKIGFFAQHDATSLIPLESTLIPEEDKLNVLIFPSPVIIVALTASSNLSVDRKNALGAGCNDYLTKPVNLVWLQKKIIEWGCMQALINFDDWKE